MRVAKRSIRWLGSLLTFGVGFTAVTTPVVAQRSNAARQWSDSAKVALADGSIEAQLPHGMVKFASVDALRAHLEKQS